MIKRISMVAMMFAVGATHGQDRVQKLLEELTNAAGPSGYEEPVTKIMVEHFKPMADKITYDGIGSVIASQGSNGPRVMLDAHMDEVGGLVRRVTPNGWMSMQMLGGWLDQSLFDQRWIIIGSKGPVKAVTGIRDTHLRTEGEPPPVFTRNSVFLDVGAKTEAEVHAMGIEPGDPVVPDSPFTVLNGTQNYLGKAWDDRVGCAILILVMERLRHAPHPNQVFYAATVQEEVGMRGGQTSAQMIKPDIGIALEVGVVKDAPDVRPEEAQEVLGGGPGFFFYDISALPNRKLVTLFKAVAAEKSIPLQYDLIEHYGEDASSIQKTGNGVPVINIVVPTRFTHSHNSIINRADFDRTVDLLVAVIESLDTSAVAKLHDFSAGAEK
jgi:putative aminopeptidase FrvX